MCAGSIPASSSSGPEAPRRGNGSNDPVEAGSTPARSAKLYGVVRGDLSAGMRAAQVSHALIEWTCRFGRPPENLVVLQVPDEDALLDLVGRLADDCRRHLFHEPDLDGEATALSVGPEGWRQLSSLPLLR